MDSIRKFRVSSEMRNVVHDLYNVRDKDNVYQILETYNNASQHILFESILQQITNHIDRPLISQDK